MSKNSLASGLIWTLISRFGAQATQLLFSLFLARLLTPEHFGQAGMVLVILGFVQIVCEAGLSSALVYFSIDDRRRLSTIYWTQLAVSVVCMVAVVASAPWVAKFFAVTAVADFAWIMALGIPFQVLTQTLSSILTHKREYRSLGLCNYIGVLIGSIVALALAYAGQGVWALAWMSLVTAATTWLAMHFATQFLPTIGFHREGFGALTRYGNPLVMHNSLNFWMRNGDNLLIGRFLGAAELGIYNRAYTLMLLPLQNISAVLGPVMFPALAAVKTDTNEFRTLYTICIRRIAMITFPIMAGMSVLSEPFIVLMYGEQWRQSAQILALLSLVGMFQSIIFPVGWVFTALGKTKEQSRLSMLLFPLFFFAIGIGLWAAGLVGVAAGYAVWALVSGLLNMRAVAGFMGFEIKDYFGLIKVKLVSTGGMVALIFCLALPMTSSLPVPVQLLVCIPLGACAYLLVLWIAKDPELRWILEFISRRKAST